MLAKLRPDIQVADDKSLIDNKSSQDSCTKNLGFKRLSILVQDNSDSFLVQENKLVIVGFLK